MLDNSGSGEASSQAPELAMLSHVAWHYAVFDTADLTCWILIMGNNNAGVSQASVGTGAAIAATSGQQHAIPSMPSQDTQLSLRPQHRSRKPGKLPHASNQAIFSADTPPLEHASLVRATNALASSTLRPKTSSRDGQADRSTSQRVQVSSTMSAMLPGWSVAKASLHACELAKLAFLTPNRVRWAPIS